MKVIKTLGGIGVVLIVVYIILVKYSTVESRFKCEGQLTSTDGATPVFVYMRLEEYRWWVGLWGDSDGAIHIEIPNTYVGYFGDVTSVGDQYQIRGSSKELVGNFSALSNTLAIRLPVSRETDFFDGTCAPY
ncbi:MAG: hypothetical protein WA208_02120 [Thermoanaerobaculia bacterium]